MDPTDEKRILHAEQTIQKGLAAVASDIEHGYYWIWSGHMLKAATQLKLGDDKASETIASLIQETKRTFAGQTKTLHLEKQNDLIWLALFIEDLDGAKSIAQIQIESMNSHPFEISVNHLLHRVLGIATLSSRPDYKPISSESNLLSELEKVISNTPSSLNGVDVFWSSLRKKRYANTIHEHTNIFRQAFEYLRRT